MIALLGCGPALQQPREQPPGASPGGPSKAKTEQPQSRPEASDDCAPFDANVIVQGTVAAKVAPGTPPFVMYAVGLEPACRARIDVTVARGRIVEIGQNRKPALDRSYGGDGSSSRKQQGDLVVSGPDGSRFALLAKGRCLKSSGDCASWELLALNRVTKRFVAVGQTGAGRSEQGAPSVDEDGRISLQLPIPKDMRFRLGEDVFNLGVIEPPLQK
jgi:hypothetical protein